MEQDWRRIRFESSQGRAFGGRWVRDIVGTLAVFLVAWGQFALIRHSLQASDSTIPAPGVEKEAQPAQNTARGHLLIPVAGIEPDQLIDSFLHPRGTDRIHKAIDITAPRHTPVLAARNGVIVGLSEGGNAGLAVLQRDPQERYAFFYAHLEGFANGVEEGDFVRQGQVIGFVGTSGNAPENVPHLHFAVHQLDSSLSFRRGRPLNPYPLLTP